MQSYRFATQTEIVYIRNMLCNSCIWHVQHLLNSCGHVEVIYIELGKAILRFDPQVFNLQNLAQILEKGGYRLVAAQKEQLVEKLKILAVQLVFYPSEHLRKLTHSSYFTRETGKAYTYLSRIFSEKTGITLEKYIILLRIERVKEMLSNENFTLAEIAWEAGYSSAQYMSNQFRQVTGETVGQYRRHPTKRIPLDALLLSNSFESSTIHLFSPSKEADDF